MLGVGAPPVAVGPTGVGVVVGWPPVGVAVGLVVGPPGVGLLAGCWLGVADGCLVTVGLGLWVGVADALGLAVGLGVLVANGAVGDGPLVTVGITPSALISSI